jgi:chorismate mutase
MVSEIGEHWPTLRSPACSTESEQAKSDVAEARGLDPLYRQALDVATGAYCR